MNTTPLTTREVAARTGERPAADAVNHPAHYNAHPTGVECIEIVEHFNFNIGNAVKYLWRAGLKRDAIEDLRKAAWYALREAMRLGWRETPTPGGEQVDTPHVEARDLFFFLDDEGRLRACPFPLMPFDKGELHPQAGALIHQGVTYARNEGCARSASRNTQFYEAKQRAAFDLLASKLEEWRKDMLHSGSYVQVQPSSKG